MTALKVGMTVVKKPGGTEFIGEVKAVYNLGDDTTPIHRMDVMSIAPGAAGLVHIYRPDQFRPATQIEMDRIKAMCAIWSGSLTKET